MCGESFYSFVVIDSRYQANECLNWTSQSVEISFQSWNRNNTTYKSLTQFFKLDKIRNLPVVCLSINGPSRTHKSFLLANIIKFLRHHGQFDTDWIKQEFGNNVLWNPGTKKVTKSVSLWLEPFVFTSSTKQFLVLLIDTPGINGYCSWDKASVFDAVISSLLSSVYLYNSKELLEVKNHLDHLVGKIEDVRAKTRLG